MLFGINSFGNNLGVLDVIIRFLVAIIVGAAIGIDRETHQRPAGLRTHVLVCLGAAVVAMIEQQSIADVQGIASSGINVSVGRLTAGVITGIGFLGAGTILSDDMRIIGLTTAASLWCTGCLGLAVGAGYIFIAAMGCFTILLVLKVLQNVLDLPDKMLLKVQLMEGQSDSELIEQFFEQEDIKLLDKKMKTHQEGEKHISTLEYRLSVPRNADLEGYIDKLSGEQRVRKASIKKL